MATARGTYSWKQRAVLGTCPWAMAQAMRSLARSWRIRSSIPEGVDPSNTARPLIYALWHETVITIIGHWRDHAIQGLASQSFDGELIASVMSHLGYPVVSRGSSSRGGAGALMSHAQALREGRHVAITVDGPRGPAYRAKPGILRVARESGVSIVPTACVASPDWRLRSWDRTQVPPPFARVAFALGEPLGAGDLEGEGALERLHEAMGRTRDKAEAILIGGTKPNK
jgi:lysophospholipid acyltransferase (LPLAT)-like uncharacterized protein